MLKISHWAKDHTWVTRLFIIFLIYPLLNITGFFLGDLLESQGFHFSALWGYVLSLLVLFLIFIYPPGNKTSGNQNIYARRKTLDVLLSSATFLFILTTGNQLSSGHQFNSIPITHASTVSLDPAPSSENSKFKKQKKIVRKWIKDVRKKYREADKGTKIVLTILAVFVAVLLILLLGALACTIACGGSEAIAFILFFLGTGGIIFGLVKVINSIHKGPKKKAPEKTNEPEIPKKS